MQMARAQLLGFAPVLLAAMLVSACRGDRVLGYVGTFSGPGSELGLSGRDGLQMRAEETGIPWISCDDRGSPEGGRDCLHLLHRSGVRVVVGPMTSVVAVPMPATAESLGMVVVSPTVSTRLLDGLADRFVRLMPDNRFQSILLARLVAAQRPAFVATVHEERNGAYARDVAHAFQEELERLGRTVALRDSFRSGPDLDFTSILARLPDSAAVLVVGSSMDLAVFHRQRALERKSLRVLASQWGMGSDLLRVAGKDAEGTVLSSMAEHGAATTAYRDFHAEFRRRFGRDPSFGAAFGWEATRLAERLIGPGDPLQRLADVLADSSDGGLGWPLGLDSLGDCHRMPLLFRVRAGVFEELR